MHVKANVNVTPVFIIFLVLYVYYYTAIKLRGKIRKTGDD